MVNVKSSQDGGEYGSLFGTHLLESLRETTELHAKEIRSIYCLLLTVTLLVAGAIVSLAFYVHESNRAAIFVSEIPASLQQESAAIPPPSTSGVHFPTEASHARYAQMLLLMQTGPEMPLLMQTGPANATQGDGSIDPDEMAKFHEETLASGLALTYGPADVQPMLRPHGPFTNCPGLEHFMNTPGCGVDVDGGE